jgi:hypothetical protein
MGAHTMPWQVPLPANVQVNNCSVPGHDLALSVSRRAERRDSFPMSDLATNQDHLAANACLFDQLVRSSRLHQGNARAYDRMNLAGR